MDYLNKIRKLFALEQDGIDGYSELEIQKLEEKINIVFPKTLRTYYQTLGANNNINYCYNRLLSPEDDVALLDGYLPIYEENQAVVTWESKRQIYLWIIRRCMQITIPHTIQTGS
ncbi:SMI1/KNR4 family protein [Sphingobacterium sp. E70]|uniref:SMI1/KNR4 family protein n=1 Tax=Sphingobacterium sp. E70 TaxID=2853439 RepID=UPI00211C0E2C|nr:SMI1/KNR4 family protein [Sphingobacterium sp. E70]ULT24227.1 SMI1/KNR4 family protein [Sphingobacterium sp. E70]